MRKWRNSEILVGRGPLFLRTISEQNAFSHMLGSLAYICCLCRLFTKWRAYIAICDDKNVSYANRLYVFCIYDEVE